VIRLRARVARWGLAAGAVAAVFVLSSAGALAATSAGRLIGCPEDRDVPGLQLLGPGYLAGHPHLARLHDLRAIRQARDLPGRPGQDQQCPTDLLGTTEAILVQPAASPVSGASAAEDQAARRITVVSQGIEVTATYDTDRALVTQILASASLPVPAASATTASQPAASRSSAANAALKLAAPAAAAEVPASATSYTGEGFDACTAPSSVYMSAWMRSSPYRAVGIYIGGADRACAQPNLTVGWISQQASAGWHFLPTYAGVQAEFGQITSPASQAVAAAEDAVTQAAALGFGPGTPIYYDMEAYPSSQESNALAFLSAWTTELHAEGYKSGSIAAPRPVSPNWLPTSPRTRCRT
jgi:hypothetical protein